MVLVNANRSDVTTVCVNQVKGVIMRISRNYQENKSFIVRMRALLIDWLTDVHLGCGLL
jgi:hypothetical protein